MKIGNVCFPYTYQILMLLLWVLIFAIVYPVGEFAINDDWAYAKNVYNIVVNKKFVNDEWPAMNLISQTLFGTIIASVFGFSFTTLRISIFILSFLSSLSLFKIIKKISGGSEFTAFAFTIAFTANAIYMHLSMTYMTEIFFVSMLIFAIHALVNFNSTQKTSSYIWFCVWIITAMLCRQQALVFCLLIIPTVLKLKQPISIKAILALLPTILCWFVSDQYRHFLTANHHGNNIQQVGHLQEYLKVASIDKHFLQATDQLLVIGWHMLPIGIFLLLNFKRQISKKDYWQFFVSAIVSIVLTIKAFQIYPLVNIGGLLEIGPRLIKESDSQINGELAKSLRIVHYILAVFSLSVILFFIVNKIKESMLLVNGVISKTTHWAIVLIYLVFVAISKAYFDRYTLPIVLLLILYITPGTIPVKKSTRIYTTSILLALYTLSLIQNLDYFNWQKQRLKAVQYLHSKGITANEIDGGFEYNGWAKKNNSYPSDTTKSWWWVIDDKYMVSAKRINKTKVDTFFVYKRYCLPKKDTVFVLNRIL